MINEGENVHIMPTVIDYDYREKIIERNIPYDNIIEKIVREPI